MVCKQCLTKLQEGAHICPNCGVRLHRWNVIKEDDTELRGQDTPRYGAASSEEAPGGDRVTLLIRVAVSFLLVLIAAMPLIIFESNPANQKIASQKAVIRETADQENPAQENISPEAVTEENESQENIKYEKTGPVRERTYLDDGRLLEEIEYEYDEYGSVIRMKATNDYLGDVDEYTIQYEYDDEGKIMLERGASTYGDKYEIEYEYDSAGNLIQEINIDDNGRVMPHSRYEYNDSGQVVSRKDYDRNGRPDGEAWWEYDQRGLMVRSYYRNSGSPESGSCEEYEYDKEGNLINKIYYYYDEEESQMYEIKYENDAQGNPLKETWYRLNGSLDMWTEYEY